MLLPATSARAAILFGDEMEDDVNESPSLPPDNGKELTRGEAVNNIVEAFNLQKRQKSFLLDCLRHADDCFFAFSAMSDYDGINFSPLILYPDVFPAYKHYKAINIASMLGLVHGFLDENTSPFHPEEGMTRIQALKVVLGAADAMRWMERFELEQKSADSGGPDYLLPYRDIDPENDAMWWYSRYMRFALENGIMDSGEYFRPDEPVTEAELNDMITRALDFSSADDNQTVASGN